MVKDELFKDFVPYDRSLRLKALGFIERVLTYFEDGNVKTYDKGTMGWDFNNSFLSCVSRPTFSQAFRWFREKYNYNQSIVFTKHPFGTDEYQYMVLLEDDECVEINFKTYEEAELACLDKLLEIVERKNI